MEVFLKPKAGAPRKRETAPAPSVDELLGISIDRRAAFRHGHMGALLDELADANQRTLETISRRSPAEMPVLPNGNLDARVQPNDSVTMPYWAFDAVYRLTIAATKNADGMGRSAKWNRKYRTALVDWHRYALIKQALADGHPWRENADGTPTAFDVVSDALKGTFFEGTESTMRRSYKEVSGNLRRGRHHLYYRSSAFAVYPHLLGLKHYIVRC
jgi:hypothetical protein